MKNCLPAISVRGFLGTLVGLSINIGVVVAFVLGNYFSYITSPIVLLIIPILFLIMVAFFPETPKYLIKSGKDKKVNLLCINGSVKINTILNLNFRMWKNQFDFIRM